MYGTVTYFTECLKAAIMNNLAVDQSSPMQVCYERMKKEIDTCKESDETKGRYLINLERASNSVLIELIGEREELNGNGN
ncbi:hypothetical protein ACW2QC_04180 [Virgibacillus sp. FSP13]